jgi:hypothetical protein
MPVSFSGYRHASSLRGSLAGRRLSGRAGFPHRLYALVRLTYAQVCVLSKALSTASAKGYGGNIFHSCLRRPFNGFKKIIPD